MKVLQSIWSLASENGGPTRSTIGLSKAMAQTGVDVTLISHVPDKVTQSKQQELRECGVSFREGRGNGFLTALKDSRQLLGELKPDIVHLHGLWKMSTHAMNLAAREFGIPVIVSPRGMLDPWALSVKKWKKRLGMLLYQRCDLKRAMAFHATSDAEAEHIRDFGLKQPIVLAPNGVAVPNNKFGSTVRPNDRIRTAMFISRLHPGKGLILLAEAWAKVRPKGWKMVVAGPDRYGHKAEVESKLRSLGIERDWEFVGELNDEEKWRALSQSDLFVHPSASENFGISIAEALGSGVPVITTKGCPWSEIDGECGWWIDRDIDALASTLQTAMSITDEERLAMGRKGRQLIAGKYSWPSIATRMLDFYAVIAK